MRKILISVAPTAATDTNIDPEAIAEDVINCARAGAGMVHMHVRKSDGSLTDDLSVFKKIVDLIRKESDIIIQASTGGVSGMTIEQRCAPLYYDAVETTSLNVGSCNLGTAIYKNPIDEVRYCIAEIIKTGKVPEIEVFEIGMIHTVCELRKEFDFHTPLLFSIVLGHPGIAPATIEALTAMRSFIPEGALWGITHAHRRDYEIFAAALGMGASTVRVGFEDSRYVDNTTEAETNLPIVEKVSALIKAMGNCPASPAEARKMLGLSA